MPITTGFNHVATLTTDSTGTRRSTATCSGPRSRSGWRRPTTTPGCSSSTWAAARRSTSSRSRRRTSSASSAARAGVARSTTSASPSTRSPTLEAVKQRLVDAGADIGEIQRLGDEWSLFFRDLDGMELEVCCHADD